MTKRGSPIRPDHLYARRLTANEILHWRLRARQTLDGYLKAGHPLVVSIKAGIRELTLRGLADLPEGRLMIAWLRKQLRDAYAVKKRHNKSGFATTQNASLDGLDDLKVDSTTDT